VFICFGEKVKINLFFLQVPFFCPKYQNKEIKTTGHHAVDFVLFHNNSEQLFDHGLLHCKASLTFWKLL
jgi:hypothetical protein